jgi:hypothetical protein
MAGYGYGGFAGGLATDHRWVPQSKTPGLDWLGKKPAACCAACGGVVDLGHPVKQYDRCVRSAYKRVMACVEAV